MNTSLIGNENGLVGYWNFNDGTARDLTVNENDGEFKGNAKTSIYLSRIGQIVGKVLMLDNKTPHVSLVMQAIEGESVLQTILTDSEGNFKFIFDKFINSNSNS